MAAISPKDPTVYAPSQVISSLDSFGGQGGRGLMLCNEPQWYSEFQRHASSTLNLAVKWLKEVNE